jgi:nucleotide-binding universal stress UspA family protein
MEILIAIDISEQAEHVLASAAPLLREMQQPHIRLLTVTDDADVHETMASTGPTGTTTPRGSWSGSSFRMPDPSAPWLLEDRTQALERVHGDLERRSAAFAAKYVDGLQVDWNVMSARNPVESILETAGTFGAHLIVVGTRGRRGVSRMLMGSTAEGVLRQSSVPVLVVGDAVGRPA